MELERKKKKGKRTKRIVLRKSLLIKGRKQIIRKKISKKMEKRIYHDLRKGEGMGIRIGRAKRKYEKKEKKERRLEKKREKRGKGRKK